MEYISKLKKQFNSRVKLVERRPNVFQILTPLYHEDGDMVDIFLEQSNGKVRVCDHGMTLMRLSYSYDIDTANKERIFRKILTENQVKEEGGDLFIDTSLDSLYPTILQFAQTVAKVSNMQLYKREVIRSLFMEMVAEFIDEKLKKYRPSPQMYPIIDRDDLEVDFKFDVQPRPLFLFGVKDNTKARLVAISCLEFQKHKVPFRSCVVHEDFEDLSRKDRTRITSASDKQFVSLDDFRENAEQYFEREAA